MKKCKNCNMKEIEGNGMCGVCYSKDYRTKNKHKIKLIAQARYLKNRKKYITSSSEWERNHRIEQRAKNRAKYRDDPEHKKLRMIRGITAYRYRNDKKECGKCRSNNNLEFHHPEPLSVDNFRVLCRDCHRELHGTLLVRSDGLAVFESKTVTENEK